MEKNYDRIYEPGKAPRVTLGKVQTEVKEIEMGRMRIVFLDIIGNPITSPNEKKEPELLKKGRELNIHDEINYLIPFEPIMTNRWVLYIDGVLQHYVKSVEIPKLDYASAQPLTVKVEFYTPIA